jgi:outer membrane protein TolC
LSLILLGTNSGCRSGKQVKDPEYCPYRNVAKTDSRLSACSSSSTTEQVSWNEPVIELTHQPQTAPDENGALPHENVEADGRRDIGMTLESLVRLALARNPEIDIARKEVDKACARIPQAASLADPMFEMISWPIYPNVEQQAGGRMIAEVMVSQEVPWKGKRESRVGQASREVNSSQNRLNAIELKVANQVKQTWFDLWLARELIKIVQRDAEFLRDLHERADTMYQAGKIGQQDILRLQSEIGLNQAEHARLVAVEESAKAELIRVLSCPPDFDLPLADELHFGIDEVLPDQATAIAQTMAASPELHAMWAAVERDQWKVTEARLNYYPDLTFSAGWGPMTTRNALSPNADGVDNLIAGVSFNLPVRIASRDAALRESESQVVQGIREWEQDRDQKARDISQILAQLSGLKKQLEKYESEIMPNLQDALEVTVTAYESNQSNLSDMINLRREILKLRNVEKELKARWLKSRADLAMLTSEIDW